MVQLKDHNYNIDIEMGKEVGLFQELIETNNNKLVTIPIIITCRIFFYFESHLAGLTTNYMQNSECPLPSHA
jgi:hypothetical protein